jgi:hypothetical protein
MAWFVDEAIKQNIKTTDVYADAAPKSAAVMRRGIGWLKKADRFKVELPLVPHGAEERFAATLEQYAHGMKLPSKFAVLEYEHSGSYDVKPDLTRALSTRRIALCVDLDSIHAVYASSIKDYEASPNDEGGLMIWAINYFDEKKEWEFAPGAAIIPRYQVNRYLEQEVSQNRVIAAYRWAKNRVSPNTFQTAMEVTWVEMLPELCDKLGDEHRQRAIHETNMDAVWAALGYFSSFGCENVSFDAEVRSSSVILPNVSRTVAIDPFHGYRELTLLGVPVWQQSSTFVPSA